MTPTPHQVPVSIIVVSRNEGEMLRRTVRSLLRTLPAGGEIIVVDDASSDGSADALPTEACVHVVRQEQNVGPSVGRNLGARRARGRMLVFSDAHIEAPPRWFGAFEAALNAPGVGAVGPTLCDMHERHSKGCGLRLRDASLSWDWLPRRGNNPYPVPFLGGFFLALRREVFWHSTGFDPGFRRWGMEDMEFVMRLWTLGYRCVLVPTVEVPHLTRRAGAFPDYQLDWRICLHNLLRVAVLHLNEERLRRVLEHYRHDEQLPAALAELAVSDVWSRREAFHRQRVRDDDWFFKRFHLTL